MKLRTPPPSGASMLTALSAASLWATVASASDLSRSYSPLPMTDMETGAPLDPNAIVELRLPADAEYPEGRTVRIRAEEWINILNEREREMNARGESLQSEADSEREPATVNAERMRSQESVIRENHHSAQPATVTTIPVARSAARLGLDKRKDWSFRYGDAHLFETSGHAAIALSANDRVASANAKAKIEASVIGNPQEILLAETGLAAPGKGDATAAVNVRLMNRDVYVKNWKSPRVEKSDRFQLPFDFSYPQRFMIGPIPTKMQVGVRGDATLSYTAAAGVLVADASLTPSIQSDAYAQFTTDILVAGAGTEGKLLLLDEDLKLKGDAAFALDEQLEPVVQISLDAHNKLESLAGRISGLAFLWVPKPWPPWRHQLKYEKELFAWEGFKIEGNIMTYKANLSRHGLTVAE